MVWHRMASEGESRIRLVRCQGMKQLAGSGTRGGTTLVECACDHIFLRLSEGRITNNI